MRHHVFPFGRQDGQVLLIVVLAMVVSLTVALALASRTVVNLRNTTDDVSSQRAFSAAESGIARAIKSGSPFADAQLDSQTTIKQVTIDTNYGRSYFLLNNGNPLPQDDGADIWLSTYPDYSAPQFSGRLQIYWGAATGCSDAALELIVISGTKTNPKLERYAVDPCNTRGNNFASPSGGAATVGGKAFRYSIAINITNGLLMRILPFYAGTPIAIAGFDGSGNPSLLPSQGKLFTAVGVSGTTQRKVSYFQGYNELPSELFHTIFQIQ